MVAIEFNFYILYNTKQLLFVHHTETKSKEGLIPSTNLGITYFLTLGYSPIQTISSSNFSTLLNLMTILLGLPFNSTCLDSEVTCTAYSVKFVNEHNNKS